LGIEKAMWKSELPASQSNTVRASWKGHSAQWEYSAKIWAKQVIKTGYPEKVRDSRKSE